MIEFIEVYSYIPDCSKVEKFKILVENIQIIYPFPENKTAILDNKTIKIKHQTILKIKDFNHRVYSDIPYKNFETIGIKPEKSKWIYPSNKLPKEKEQVIVQLDLDKINICDLGKDDELNILNDKNHTYLGYICNGWWTFDRQCFYDSNYNKDTDAEDGVMSYSPCEEDKEKYTLEEYNQIILKWQYLPKENKEKTITSRFDLMDFKNG